MATDNVFTFGDSVVATINWTDPVSGHATAAATICTVRAPSGATQVLAVSNPALGEYQASVVPDERGRWFIRWEASAPFAAAEEVSFLVEPSAVL